MSKNNDPMLPKIKGIFDPFEQKLRADYFPFIPPGIFAFLSDFLFFIGRFA